MKKYEEEKLEREARLVELQKELEGKRAEREVQM